METKEFEKLTAALETILECGFVTREKFDAEKNAKNKAYYFILSNGHLNDFEKFSLEHNTNDQHNDCIEYLYQKATE